MTRVLSCWFLYIYVFSALNLIGSILICFFACFCSLHWWVTNPINALGGVCWLFAFGLRPRSVCFVVLFLWCLVFCVGGYAYLTGGCALLPYARFTVLCICHLLFCTVCAEITGISVSDFFYYVYIQDRAFELNRPYQRKKNGSLGGVLVNASSEVTAWFGIALDGKTREQLGAFDKGTNIYELELLAAVVSLNLWMETMVISCQFILVTMMVLGFAYQSNFDWR